MKGRQKGGGKVVGGFFLGDGTAIKCRRGYTGISMGLFPDFQNPGIPRQAAVRFNAMSACRASSL